MSEKSVGTLAAKVMANADNFHAAIDGAIKKAGNFGTNVGRMLTAPLAGVTGLASAPLKAVEGFAKPLQSALSSIPFIGGAFAAIPASAGAFMAWLEEGRHKIIEQGKLADKLGVSMKDAAVVQFVGGGSEDFEHAIDH